MDRVVESLAAVKQRRILPQRLLAPEGNLPTVVGVVVFVNRGVFAQQNKLVGMATIAEVKLHAVAQILFEPGKPGLGALPGVEVSVELIGAEWFIPVAQHHQSPPQSGLEAAVGEDGD